MTTDNIQQLIDLFFDGTTTLQEEQALYAYFNSDNVAEQHLPWREMFRDIATLNTPAPDSVSVSVPVKKTVPVKTNRIWTAAAAIIAFTILTATITIQDNVRKLAYLEAKYQGSYIIVDGKRIDNISTIHTQLDSTLNVADAIEQKTKQQYDVDEVVSDLISSYKNPQAQQAIQKALQ